MNNHFPKYWVVASILDFLVHKKYTVTLLWAETFVIVWMVYLKKIRLFTGTDFKNVHLTSVIVHLKKRKKNVVYFLLGSNIHYWNQNEKTNSLIPYSTYLKKRSYLLDGAMKIRISVFINCLRFSSLFENFMPHIKIMKFCQKTSRLNREPLERKFSYVQMVQCDDARRDG